MNNPAQFLQHGIELNHRSTGDVKTVCPQCSQQRRKSNDPSLSVNVEKGCWRCHHCGWSGGLGNANAMAPVMRQLAQRAKKTYVKPEAPERRSLSQQAAQWLDTRAISTDTVENAGGTMQNGKIALPYLKHGEVVNIKYRSFPDKGFAQAKGGMPVLWRFDECMKHERIIIVEGEMDALALLECGFDNATSIPAGSDKNASDLPEHSAKFEFLENSKELIDNAKEILLWLDDDEAGRAMQAELLRRIGKKKCMHIVDNLGHKDANDLLLYEGKQLFRQVVESAQHYPIEEVVTYTDAIREIADYDPLKQVGLSTGYPEFDEYFRMAPGDLCVIVGIPQSGKSEFCDQLILNTITNAGWQWAYYTPENMPVERHFCRMAEKFHKRPWSKLSAEDKASAIATLSKYVYLINPTESITIDGLLERVDALVYRHGIKGFILDPWNEVEHKRDAHFSETEYIGMILQKCRQFARNRGIAFIIVAHPTKMSKMQSGEYPVPTPYDISGSANWRNKPDSCLSVWRSFTKETNVVQVHVCKMRNKYAGKNGVCEFVFDIATGTYKIHNQRFADEDCPGHQQQPRKDVW